MDNEQVKNTAFSDADQLYGKEVNAVPKPEKEIGISLDNDVLDNILSAGSASHVDISQIESFTQISRSRDQIYDLLDSMATDSKVSAILETYAEDATERNDAGKIVWVESSDVEVGQFVQFLLDSMRIDKNIYKWTYNLIKYGDVYLRLYRKSDYNDPIFDEINSEYDKGAKKKLDEDLSGDIKDPDEESKEKLDENLNIIAYKKNDKYARYVEMVHNPAEMFELTRFGKTVGYIQAQLPKQMKQNNLESALFTMRYNFNRNDVNLYGSREFVHAMLEDENSRYHEQICLFQVDQTDNQAIENASYDVRHGQSIMYNQFKQWRELMLLENSILLNRLTKSSLVRVLNVEVGNQSKESVPGILQRIKTLFEQKTALNVAKSMSEYTNPGPIDNTIYVPTYNGTGSISAQQIGGDVDIKGLADLDYYQDGFYGGFRVPKQYFGITDDGAGFSGGESLALISSRYAKAVKRIQSSMIQAITDIINLMLIDEGLDNYINKFTIKMLPPTTREQIERRESISTQIGLVRDLMDVLSDISDTDAKLKMLKALLSSFVDNQEVLNILQEEIDKLDAEKTTEDSDDEDNKGGESSGEEDEMFSSNEPLGLGDDSLLSGLDDYMSSEEGSSSSSETSPEIAGGEISSGSESGGESLPSPSDLGLDFTDSNNPEFG